MSTDERESLVGSPIERREDMSLLTGSGEYTNDIDRRNLTHAAILRSPHGRARIEDIDTATAEAMDSVHAVYTGQDVADSDIPNNIQTGWKLPELEEPHSESWRRTPSATRASRSQWSSVIPPPRQWTPPPLST